jgi:hypothetical protein
VTTVSVINCLLLCRTTIWQKQNRATNICPVIPAMVLLWSVIPGGKAMIFLV